MMKKMAPIWCTRILFSGLMLSQLGLAVSVQASIGRAACTNAFVIVQSVSDLLHQDFSLRLDAFPVRACSLCVSSIGRVACRNAIIIVPDVI